MVAMRKAVSMLVLVAVPVLAMLAVLVFVRMFVVLAAGAQ
jgi:hypothetical protein